MTTSTILSRPIYPGLSPDLNARSNLIVCDKAGAEAVKEMFSRAEQAFAERSAVIVADNVSAGDAAQIESALAPSKPEFVATLGEGVARLRDILEQAPMGLRLYVAGSEPLIGSVVQAAADYAIDHLSIRTEHRGSLKRRVQCVHCKGFTEDVTTNPVTCAHCRLTLFVRDHYSRRLAAFQGVCIDAEVPGEVPPTEALYL
jgi:dimethylamine monooxygenase subunit C